MDGLLRSSALRSTNPTTYNALSGFCCRALQFSQMLMVPEARTALLRTTVVSAIAVVLVIGAIRTGRRRVRILLGIIATPITAFAVFGMFVVYLILRHGPR